MELHFSSDHVLKCSSCVEVAEDSLLMSVLKEKPIQLLGRLVFERNIRPEK